MKKTAAPHLIGLLAGAAAAVSLSSPAEAQSFSKTEAILGAPSALEALLAQQSGRPFAAPVRASFQPAIRPASLPYRPLVSAVFRDRLAVSPGVANGHPDIFGTVALRVGHTGLDARWHKVEHSGVAGSAARFADTLRARDKVQRLEAINWYVNKRVHFVDDQVQYGRVDVWATASDTLARGRGDCEDFAIAKLQMLRRAGIADRDLYLVIVKDLVRRADHAILVVRAGGHMYVLDNGSDRLLDSESVSDYRPVLTFTASGSWTHGYRVKSAPMNIASASDQRAGLVPASDAADQRSRSASLLAFNTGLSR
jgi:predicted transglutaminase-like cysteine proteinase